MSIFRRRSAEPERPAPESDETLSAAVEDAEPANEVDLVDAPVDRSTGPFDAAEVDGLEDRLDLGALWLPPIAGAELRLEVDQASETVSALQLVIGDSAAQVQAFAAPRSGGVWREIRGELAEAITAAGGTVEEVAGAFGPQLNVRMPQQGPDGRAVFAPARFVGIDGPRWFLRAVLSGQAAIDDAAAAALTDGLRQIVVNRGHSPMAPRELLPMQVPTQPQPEPESEAAEQDQAEGPDARYQRPDLNPFERGPEITEVR